MQLYYIKSIKQSNFMNIFVGVIKFRRNIDRRYRDSQFIVSKKF